MTFLALTRPRRAVPPWRRPLLPARPRPAPAPRAAGRAGRGAGPGGLRPQGGSAARAPARRRHARAGRRRAAGLDPAGRSAGALQHAAVVPRRRQDRRTPGPPGRCRDARPDRGPAGSGRRRQERGQRPRPALGRPAPAGLRQAAAGPRPSPGAREPDRRHPAGTDPQRLRLGAGAARPGRAAIGAGRRPAQIHHPAGRPRRRDHRRAGRHRSERFGRPGGLQPGLVGRYRRHLRRARKPAGQPGGGPARQRHAGPAARPDLRRRAARDRARRRSAEPHLPRQAHAGKPQARGPPGHDSQHQLQQRQRQWRGDLHAAGHRAVP